MSWKLLVNVNNIKLPLTSINVCIFTYLNANNCLSFTGNPYSNYIVKHLTATSIVNNTEDSTMIKDVYGSNETIGNDIIMGIHTIRYTLIKHIIKFHINFPLLFGSIRGINIIKFVKP